MMYYKISHGSVTLGNNTVLEDVNFCVKDNEKNGIVGRNGSGKTTLLKAIIGEYEINSGYEEVDIISSKYGLDVIPANFVYDEIRRFRKIYVANNDKDNIRCKSLKKKRK